MPSITRLLRRAVSQPPHRLAGKIYRFVRRNQQLRRRRLRDTTLPTWAFDFDASRPLLRYFPALPLEMLLPHAEQFAALTQAHLQNRFDLLGSGWQTVGYGIVCPGVEGRSFSMGQPVTADTEGGWLTGRLNAPNLPEAQRLWRLIEGDYTPIDWQLDFKSGYRWSEAVWFKEITYGTAPGVDVKVPWELSRMQHLPLFAWAFALARAETPGFTAPEVYARAFRNQVLDFLATNPPHFGVNWVCPMDVGIRVANWLVGYDLFRAYGMEFDAEFEQAFRRSIYEQARYLQANLEWSATFRSNHYLADLAGLLFACAYLPNTPETDTWLAMALQEICAEVMGQFDAQGANAEASTSYHRLSAEMVVYGTALLLALPPEKRAALERADTRLAPNPPGLTRTPHQSDFFAELPYAPRLEGMAQFILDITKPTGNIPQFGDNDSGRFLKLLPACHKHPERGWETNDLDLRHLVAAVNGFFRREDFARFAADYALETEIVAALLQGKTLPSRLSRPAHTLQDEEAHERLIALCARAPESQRRVTVFAYPGSDLRDGLRCIAYPDFGLYLFRSARLYLAVRCGSNGQNGNGGHAHNDQLGIELNVDGRDILTDPGTYLYTALPERRNAYRSVKAHFAPYVAGKEPGDLTKGLFTLGNEAQARAFYFGPNGFIGAHQGYGVPVYRGIALEASRIVITDVLHPEGSTDLRLAENPPLPPFSAGYGKRARELS